MDKAGRFVSSLFAELLSLSVDEPSVARSGLFDGLFSMISGGKKIKVGRRGSIEAGARNIEWVRSKYECEKCCLVDQRNKK